MFQVYVWLVPYPLSCSRVLEVTTGWVVSAKTKNLCVGVYFRIICILDSFVLAPKFSSCVQG